MIALDLDSKADPALLQKVADYFLENNQFDKAVDLLAIAKKVMLKLFNKFMALE